MKNILTLLVFIAVTNISEAQSWMPIGTGMDNEVTALLTDTVNDVLYAGGLFTNAGTVSAANIAKWNGTVWTDLGGGVNGQVRTLAFYNGELYAGGSFSSAGIVSASNIAKWNGVSWSAVSGGTDGDIFSLFVYNGDLYVGGLFTNAGGVAAENIARWNGSSWSAMGTGLPGGLVASMQEYNNQLYAGGGFQLSGGKGIAVWNGSTWSVVGGGMLGQFGYTNVVSLEKYNGKLYAGGLFFQAGGNPASYVASWDAATWSAVGTGTDDMVNTMCLYNGSLYLGGWFKNANGVATNRIVKLTNSTWTLMGAGIDGTVLSTYVHAIAPYHNELYVGGAFTIAGGNPANYIAKWGNSLGIHESDSDKNILVYANPFAEQTAIEVEMKNNSNVELVLYNSLGEKLSVLQNGMLTPGKYKYQIKTPAEGVYFLHSTIGDKNETLKLVRTR
jgi:hypothetical protein